MIGCCDDSSVSLDAPLDAVGRMLLSLRVSIDAFEAGVLPGPVLAHRLSRIAATLRHAADGDIELLAVADHIDQRVKTLTRAAA